MKFFLTDEQVEKFNAWAEKKGPAAEVGAIGGRWTFSFTHTSLGTVVKITDGCDGTVLDVTDYDAW